MGACNTEEICPEPALHHQPGVDREAGAGEHIQQMHASSWDCLRGQLGNTPAPLPGLVAPGKAGAFAPFAQDSCTTWLHRGGGPQWPGAQLGLGSPSW